MMGRRRSGVAGVMMTGAGVTRRQQRELIKTQAKLAEEKRKATQAAIVQLPSPISPGAGWGRLTNGGMWGPVTATVPAHKVSMVRAGGLNPFLASNGTGLDCPPMGVASDGGYFAYDPWDAYKAKLTTSTGIVAIGGMGAGKSLNAKKLAVTLMARGRKVICMSDPKGEWARVADWIATPWEPYASQVIRVGEASRNVLNPLDGGQRDPTVPDTVWFTALQEARATRIRSLVTMLRRGGDFTPQEQNAVELAVAGAAANRSNPTIGDVYDQLLDPTPEMVALCGREATAMLANALWRLARGGLAAMFNGQSTVRLDPRAALTVIDTSSVVAAASQTASIVSECVTGFITSTLRARDGSFRLLIAEEGWQDFKNPDRVAGLDEILRLSGHWGVALMLIFHELKDIDMFGDAGSAHRGQLKGLLSKCETQILFKSSVNEKTNLTEALGLTGEEVELVTKHLHQGEALWRIGQSLRCVVRAVATAEAYEVFDTSTGREG